MSTTKAWTIEVVLTEDEDRTKAEATLQLGDLELRATGRSRRNPSDPDIPKIGEELATARALTDLSHQLVHAAAQNIEAFEGRPVSLSG